MPEVSPRPRLAAAEAYPIGTRLNERGRLEVGGCDVVELAAEHGTPAYIYAEDDLRERARRYMDAAGGGPGASQGRRPAEVLFASKALPCTAAYRLFAEEGLSVDVASGGELHMALAAGYDPGRIHLHGNNKTDAEILKAREAGVGLVILDSFDEIERWEHLLGGRQRVMVRVTPGVTASTHSSVQTGQVDSKFGFGIEGGHAERAIARVLDSGRLELVGLHAHIGSQIFDLEPYSAEIAALSELAGAWCEAVNVGGGLAVAYTEGDSPPGIEDAVAFQLEALDRHFPSGVRAILEPGRSLVANAGITAYRVGTRKEIPDVRTYVSVDGGMSDNLRPMLYGADYHAAIADRAGEEPTEAVTVAGMHCESGDIIVREARLPDPRPGDVLVTPATGAYGHAMANNYNGIPRPPVIFCREGRSRPVVRRETYDDLLARDV